MTDPLPMRFSELPLLLEGCRCRRRAWRPWRIMTFDADGVPRYVGYPNARVILTADDFRANDWEVL